MQEQIKIDMEQQQNLQRAMMNMRQMDHNLMKLDQALKGMEKIATDNKLKSKQKILESLGKLRIGKGNYEIKIQDLNKLTRHTFSMPLGGGQERYSCFYTKKRPRSFHTDALDEKKIAQIKFDLTEMGETGEKLAVFVKGDNIEAKFEVSNKDINRTSNLKEGFIRFKADVASTSDPKIVLKKESELTYSRCEEADLEELKKTASPTGDANYFDDPKNFQGDGVQEF